MCGAKQCSGYTARRRTDVRGKFQSNQFVRPAVYYDAIRNEFSGYTNSTGNVLLKKDRL